MKFKSLREEVITTCRSLADRGYLAGTGGNVAFRADAEHIAVTPSATDYYTMSPEDVCVVRLEDLTQVAGEQRPSVETGLHAKVLVARTDCSVSIHTHQPIASAYTLLAKPLTIETEAYRQLLGKTIPCAGYAPSGTAWLASRVARRLKPGVHAYLLRNHGVVCVGADVDVAMRRVAALEEVCSEFFEQKVSAEGQSLPKSVVNAVRQTLACSISVEGSTVIL